ncbi:hypothetical protein [Persicitalea sp.]|uniref:hypothetical protein n=1 Tax=Persicitalea sp. TaxID=3100273 RepID=UPI0035945D85
MEKWLSFQKKKKIMVIERQDDKIVIEPLSSINMNAVQQVIDYINALEIVSQNQGTEEQAGEMAREINREWWKKNRDRFVG